MAGEPVLVVDDNPTNLKLLRYLLSTRGYQVRTATDGDEVMSILQSFRPRLILMDIQLPGIDGLELTRRIKKAPETRDIVIIAVTASAMKGDEERTRAAGCDAYVAKPIDTRALPALVEDYLGRRQPPGGTP